MVLLKDLDDTAHSVLRKNYAYEKTWEVEYFSKAKQISWTSSLFSTFFGSGLQSSSTIHVYPLEGLSAEVKVAKNGLSSIDLRYCIPAPFFYGSPTPLKTTSFITSYPLSCSPSTCSSLISLLSRFSLGAKVEQKYKLKGKFHESYSVNFSCEYDDKKYLHSKFVINPITMVSVASLCVQNRFTCGILKLAADFNFNDAYKVIRKTNGLNFGISFIKMKNEENLFSSHHAIEWFRKRKEFALFPNYIISCKTMTNNGNDIATTNNGNCDNNLCKTHLNGPGKIIGSVYTSAIVGSRRYLLDLAAEVEHKLNAIDQPTKLLMGCALYLDPFAKDAAFRLKFSHDLQTVALSASYPIAKNASCSLACKFNPYKLLDPHSSMYGLKLSLSS